MSKPSIRYKNPTAGAIIELTSAMSSLDEALRLKDFERLQHSQAHLNAALELVLRIAKTIHEQESE